MQELHTDWTTKFFRTDARKFPECPTSARRIAEDRCTVSSRVHPTIAVENTPAPMEDHAPSSTLHIISRVVFLLHFLAHVLTP